MDDTTDGGTKYSVPDDHWDEDDEEPETDPAVRVGTHHLEIYDERDSIERYNGLVWSAVIEDGTIVGVSKAHYCPGPMNRDLIGPVAWGDIPRPVRRAFVNALNGHPNGGDGVVDIPAIQEVAD
jgi:hypothetical protein